MKQRRYGSKSRDSGFKFDETDSDVNQRHGHKAQLTENVG